MKHLFFGIAWLLAKIGVVIGAFFVMIWEFSFSEAADFIEENDWDSLYEEARVGFVVLGLLTIGICTGIYFWRADAVDNSKQQKFEAEYAEMLKRPPTPAAPSKKQPQTLEKP